MFKVFGAIGRFFRAILYSFAGDVSKWSELWESKTGYIQAEYEDIEKGVIKDANDTADAYAEYKVVIDEKEDRLKKLTVAVGDQKKKMAGAQAAAQKRVKLLQSQGKAGPEIQQDAEVQRCLEWYENFKSTAEAKEEDADSLEADIETDQSKLQKMKRFLERTQSELQKVKQEKSETIADHRMSDAEERVASMLTGIGQNDNTERRARMQQLRRKRKAKSEAMADLAGVATGDAEEEFLSHAASTEATSEFFDKLGIAETTEESGVPQGSPADRTQIPE